MSRQDAISATTPPDHDGRGTTRWACEVTRVPEGVTYFSGGTVALCSTHSDRDRGVVPAEVQSHREAIIVKGVLS